MGKTYKKEKSTLSLKKRNTVKKKIKRDKQLKILFNKIPSMDDIEKEMDEIFGKGE